MPVVRPRLRRAFFCLPIIAVASATHCPALAGCDLELQGEGHVVAVTGPRTIRLDDGRDVRLAGIEIPAESKGAAETILARAALDRDVTLHGRTDTPDRYGRQPAFVMVYGEETSLQETLAGKGTAIVGDVEDKSCLTTLQASETAARDKRMGVWSSSTFVKDAADPDKILNDLGHFAIVEGNVLSGRQAGDTFYLNFSRRWNQGFAVTISRRMMTSFAAAGLPPAALDNKRIRVRGWIEKRGGPRIEVTRPDQIELIGDNSARVAGGD